MKNLLPVCFFVLLITSCKKDTPFVSPENSLITFQVRAVNNVKQLDRDILFEISDTLVSGITGSMMNKQTLTADFTSSGVSVMVDGVEQISGVTTNDFTNPVIYTVTAENGTQRKYTVKLRSFTGLPVIYINTVAPVVSKEDYVNGTMKIDGNMNFSEGLYDGKIEIRGRGNSTWNQEKKPYKIKLDKKAVVLGMPSDKEWALLANYLDKSLMRNDIAFELSERVGLAWTPRRRFVEVFMNSEYIGNYLLTETVKTGTDRLNISPMTNKSPSDTAGGYLVETDFRLEGDQWFKTDALVPLVLKEPEPASAVQFQSIRNRFQSLENGISYYADVRNQIDIDSWIKWVIVNEVMRNRDGVLFGSCFFYGNNNKIFMGPVWDFDLSSGAYTGSDPQGWYIHTASWIGGLFNYHPYYKERFKQIWTESYPSIVSIKDYIQSDNTLLKYSQEENFQRWNILNTRSYDEQILSGTYKGDVDQLSDFLDQRINWINAQVASW